MGARKDRTGEINVNTQGCKMTIIAYRMNRDMDIEFEDGVVVYNTCYISFKKGEIKNFNYPDIYGVGYLGYGEYTCEKHRAIYNTWFNMLNRCYNPKYHKTRPTYFRCVVCNEWHNFQNFADWYEKNYYTVGLEKMCLDKDILVKGNKTYSPETCVFVTRFINSIFTKRDSDRGKYPIGVSKDKKYEKYQPFVSKFGKALHLPTFNTPLEAFNCYKAEKEKYIQEVANMYKGKIPLKLYVALIKYKVEIID